MNHSPGRFVGLAYPYVAMDPALDNEHDPTDQDSRTLFPDKDHRSLRGRMLVQKKVPRMHSRADAGHDRRIDHVRLRPAGQCLITRPESRCG
jgi:hypothetical protein